jgi:hypothetical protein
MRWLMKYPVTTEEVMHELNAIQVNASDVGVGSLGPMIRADIKKYFENDDNMNLLLEFMRVK